MTQDRDEFRRRAVRAALTVVAIAVAIGLVIGLLTAGVVYLSDALPDEGAEETVAVPTADPEEEVPSPSLSPSASASRPPSPSASPSPTARDSRDARREPASGRSRSTPRAAPIQLHAGSASAGRYDRVTLQGRYAGGNGKTLAVQRFEGGAWRAFPTSATVRGGAFSTYIASGRPGPNRFRVVDRATGRTSNVVVIRVG